MGAPQEEGEEEEGLISLTPFLGVEEVEGEVVEVEAEEGELLLLELLTLARLTLRGEDEVEGEEQSSGRY